MMYMFTWHDMLMAGRFFQSANIAELVEAMNMDCDERTSEPFSSDGAEPVRVGRVTRIK